MNLNLISQSLLFIYNFLGFNMDFLFNKTWGAPHFQNQIQIVFIRFFEHREFDYYDDHENNQYFISFVVKTDDYHQNYQVDAVLHFHYKFMTDLLLILRTLDCFSYRNEPRILV